MEKNLTKKKCFIIAGCILLLYSLCNIGQEVYEIMSYPITLNFSIFVYWAYIASILVLSLMLFVRRNNLGITISLGIMSLINLYWCIDGISYMFKYFDVYDLLLWISYLSSIISPTLLMFISIMTYKNATSDIGKLWFVPAVFEFLYLVISVVVDISFGISFANFIIEQTIYCVGIAFVGFSLYSTNIIKGENLNYTPSLNDGYCDMTIHILLWLFIGVIWQYIWIYRTTKFLNITKNEEKRNPVTKLLLCMFVPFYYIYWIYQSARRVEILAKEKNIDSDIVTLSVVLSFFIGIVPPIIIQGKLNQVCKSESQTLNIAKENTTFQYVERKVEINSDKTEEIRNYKKLFDDGIITEEEFEAKKRQLLGI